MAERSMNIAWSLSWRMKQWLNRTLIGSGLRNPGAKDRHDWVGFGCHETKREWQIRFLKSQGLLPEHTLLDLGCGTLRGGIPIIDYLNTGNYCGIDVRKRVLAEARKELMEHRLEGKEPIIMTVKDAHKYIASAFDVIWAFQVFLHMSPAKHEEALEFAAKHLKPDGSLYATALIEDYYGGQWQGFPVISRSLQFYESEAERFGLTVLSLGTLESLGWRRHDGKPSGSLMLKFRHKA